MRHVVTLDAQRSLGETEQILQFGQGPTSAVVITRSTHPMTQELIGCITGHRLEQRLLIAPLRNPDLHLGPAFCC